MTSSQQANAEGDLIALLNALKDFPANGQDEARNAICVAIFNQDPFTSFRERYFFFGEGGGMPGSPETIGRSLAALMERGLSPEELVTGVRENLERNRLTLFEVTGLVGAYFNERIDIDDSSWIGPEAHAPFANQFQRGIFSSPSALMPVLGYTALVHRFELSPLFLPVAASAERAKYDKVVIQNLLIRKEERAAIRRALVLSTDVGVFETGTYVTSEKPSVFSLERSLSRGATGQLLLGRFPNVDVFRRTFRLLKEFEGARKDLLGIAIDRLSNARATIDPVNNAIDLGIAMEAVIVNDMDEVKGEINYRIGTRVGLLLGTTVEERRAYKKRADRLYSARSSAVHTGKLKSPFDHNEAMGLVQELIMSVLELGRFPDWLDFTFGQGVGAV